MTASVSKSERSDPAAGSWTLKGVDPQARERAQDLARRSGVSLAEWLNQRIADAGEEGPEAKTEGAGLPRQGPGRRSGDRDAVSAIAEFANRLEATELRSTLAISGIGQQALGLLSRLDDLERDQAGVVALVDGALEEMRDVRDRVVQRLRSLEVGEDARVEAMKALEGAIGAMAAQISDSAVRAETAESQVGASVADMQRRLERIELQPVPDTSPLDAALARLAVRVEGLETLPPPTFDTASIDAAFARLLYRMEDGQQRTFDTLQALEGAVGGLNRRIGRIEDSQPETPEAAPEMESVDEAEAEADGYGEAWAIEAPAMEPPAIGAADPVGVGDGDALEAETDEALEIAAARTEEPFVWEEEARGFADSFDDEPAPDALDAVAAEPTELEAIAPETAGTIPADMDGGDKLDRIASAMRGLSEQFATAEHRSSQAIDGMGRDVARLASELDGRMSEIEQRSDARQTQVSGEIARIAEAFETRLARADGAQAAALERLGGEIASVAEKLADRIAASERRAAQDLSEGLEGVSAQLERATDSTGSTPEVAAAGPAAFADHGEEPTGEPLMEAWRLDSAWSMPAETVGVTADPHAAVAHHGDADSARPEAAFEAAAPEDAQEPIGEAETQPMPRRTTRELIEHAFAAARNGGGEGERPPAAAQPAPGLAAGRGGFGFLKLLGRERTPA